MKSLTYKGSIPDAINQSRREKKLFVVYLSGEDETSRGLECSTLVDEHVAQVIGRYCIFLHLKQGNVDALQFSAIYPQKSIPSVSVIGLNGVMLWNHEGYIRPEDLKENIEKAWAALHVQETEATLLTASRMAEPVNTDSTSLPAQDGSSTSENHSNSSSKSIGCSAVSEFDNSTDFVAVAQTPNSTGHAVLLKINEQESSESDSAPGDISVEEKLDSACKAALPDCSGSSNVDSCKNPIQRDSTLSPKRKNKVNGSGTAAPSEPIPSITNDRSISSKSPVEQDKATSSTPTELTTNSAKKDDIQLVIRMSNGPSLQIKLTKGDVLRKVKNFVDENQGSGVGSYNLAMLYPRTLFTEQDMEKTLYELGIETRQALLVVPNHQSVKVPRHQLSSPSRGFDRHKDSDNSGSSGYWGILGSALSYINPLSYLRGDPTSSNPEQLGNEGSQQYRRSSSPLNHPGTEAASEPRPLASNRSQETASHSSGNSLRRRPRQFGANIHTLSSEEQGPSDDRNVFWNGNSTEFGSDDKK
ncbi:plant UBX domain-containing protein 11 isoform X1 [Brachypodium distachyon]|nr:plant UBX domain-containing protein 11 isoform X1 [Brachypodium distachyon]KQJ88655.1 hypothetical protein BRADI_4g20210v3 [Brachypodium distachyon]|eukprot:XP_010237758.1 plant UBX domain-containing protein 11 isoform X1 [Brachypodium distachyon]